MLIAFPNRKRLRNWRHWVRSASSRTSWSMCRSGHRRCPGGEETWCVQKGWCAWTEMWMETRKRACGKALWVQVTVKGPIYRLREGPSCERRSIALQPTSARIGCHVHGAPARSRVPIGCPSSPCPDQLMARVCSVRTCSHLPTANLNKYTSISSFPAKW